MKKEEIMKVLQDEIELLHVKFDELRVQADLGGKEIKEALKPEIDKIEIQLSKAKTQMDEITRASLDALADMKEGAELALTSISEAIKSAAERFK